MSFVEPAIRKTSETPSPYVPCCWFWVFIRTYLVLVSFITGGLLALAPDAPQVFSWDTSINAVDENEDDGRSYIRAISESIVDDSEACEFRPKNNMGEARMDIEKSEMAYLGFHDSESYGLTWKVRGK